MISLVLLETYHRVEPSIKTCLNTFLFIFTYYIRNLGSQSINIRMYYHKYLQRRVITFGFNCVLEKYDVCIHWVMRTTLFCFQTSIQFVIATESSSNPPFTTSRVHVYYNHPTSSSSSKSSQLNEQPCTRTRIESSFISKK